MPVFWKEAGRAGMRRKCTLAEQGASDRVIWQPLLPFLGWLSRCTSCKTKREDEKSDDGGEKCGKGSEAATWMFASCVVHLSSEQTIPAWDLDMAFWQYQQSSCSQDTLRSIWVCLGPRGDVCSAEQVHVVKTSSSDPPVTTEDLTISGRLPSEQNTLGSISERLYQQFSEL